MAAAPTATEATMYLIGSQFVPAAQVRTLRRRRRRRDLARFSGYRGADSKRPTASWIPGSGSADEALLGDLGKLRDRCRDLARNDSLAVGAIDTDVENVVGTGFVPQCRPYTRPLGWSEDRIQDFTDAAEENWRQCAGALDATETMGFDDLTRMIWRQRRVNGEAFALRRHIDDDSRPCGLAWEVIEADRVDTPLGKISAKDTRAGIVRNDDGAAVSYWINKQHPGDLTVGRLAMSREWINVPRRDPTGRPNVLHLYQPSRPGQSRGVPFLAPVVGMLRHLNGYIEAEVIAARVNACFATAVTSEETLDIADDRTDPEATASAEEPIESFEPGMNYYLKPNEKLETVAANRPNSGAAGFVELFCRLIGAALGMPYELLLKNFSKTNYSSARAALLEARRGFKAAQKWLIWAWCRPNWDLVMEEAVLRDRLPVTRAEWLIARPYLTRARWLTPRWGWVDPTKEVAATVTALDNNLISLADAVAELGGDWQETLDQCAREKAYRQELGLSAPSADPSPAPADDDDEKEDD